MPGAWHNPTCWKKITPLVEAQGYKCICVTLPSTTGNNVATYKQDIDSVRDPIQAEVSTGRDVVVVMHSYGGAVGASAIKGLTLPTPGVPSSEDSSVGHVIGLVYIASGFGPSGISFLQGLGGNPPPSWKLDPSGFATLVAEPRELFYHDLPEEEGNYWVGKLEKQAQKPFQEGGEYSYAGWMDVPSWYLSTTEDKALPVQAQTYFIQIAKDAGADVTVREVSSSHFPMLSKPNETAEFLLEAVTDFVGKKEQAGL